MCRCIQRPCCWRGLRAGLAGVAWSRAAIIRLFRDGDPQSTAEFMANFSKTMQVDPFIGCQAAAHGKDNVGAIFRPSPTQFQARYHPTRAVCCALLGAWPFAG